MERGWGGRLTPSLGADAAQTAVPVPASAPAPVRALSLPVSPARVRGSRLRSVEGLTKATQLTPPLISRLGLLGPGRKGKNRVACVWEAVGARVVPPPPAPHRRLGP